MLLSLFLDTIPLRTCALERDKDARQLGSTCIASAFGLKASREQRGDGYWYHVEEIFSLGADSGEKGIIAELDAILSKPDDCSLLPFVVGFRSSAFDFPVLKLRAMRHRIPLACFGAPGEDRYGRGGGRLTPRYHFDLSNEVLGYRQASLDEVCDLLAIPRRAQRVRRGSDHSAGESLKPHEWGELTTVVMWAIFLQWSLVINELDAQTFERSLESFCAFLRDAGETKPHIARWLESYLSSAETESDPFSRLSTSR